MIKLNHILHNYIQATSFTIHNVNFNLINCYLPSGNTSTKISQRVKAIQNIISFLNNLNFRHRKLIIVGNSNLVINPIERTGYFSPNTNDKIIFHQLLLNFDLIESYRYLTKVFSFSHLHPISRLDRIYASSTLIPNIFQNSYQANAFSDHNNFPSIIIKIPPTSSLKSSNWKLNNSILSILCNNFLIKYFI